MDKFLNDVIKHYDVGDMTLKDVSKKSDELRASASKKSSLDKKLESIINKVTGKKPKSEVKVSSPSVVRINRQQGPPAPKTIESYSRAPKKKTLPPLQPKKKESKPNRTIETTVSKVTTPSTSQQKVVIDKVSRDAYNKLSPIDKIKYKMRNR